jgi:uncharacterized protein (DUF885 family)
MRVYQVHPAVLLVLASLTTNAHAISQDEAERLHSLFRAHEAWEAQESPYVGGTDQARSRPLFRWTMEAIARRHDRLREFHQELLSIDPSSLNPVDRLNHEVFDYLLREEIGHFEHQSHVMAVGSFYGIHLWIADLPIGVRFRDERDCEDYLARLEHVPIRVGDAIALMRDGIKAGRTPPRTTIEHVPGIIDSLLDSNLAGFDAPFRQDWGNLPEESADALWVRFHRRSLVAVRRGLVHLRGFLVDEYIPQCRDSIAAGELPNGRAFYEYRLRQLTTTDHSPEHLHALGQRQVAHIRPQMMAAIRRTDFVTQSPAAAALDDERLFAAFRTHVLADDRFYFDDAEALLAAWRTISKHVDLWLPSMFRTLPRLPYGIMPLPRTGADAEAQAIYRRGDLEHGYPSIVFVNTARLRATRRFELAPLVLHESAPGHHVQIALAQELSGVPPFRRSAWHVSFGEGWALYAESLGEQMGLYEDPYDDFGRLQSRMWRACRLVIDTGIHALGWPRERAEALLRQHTTFDDTVIKQEIDRFINWPGQATTYTLGELKIHELRALAEQALGARFDIREFHDVVLLAGSVPLPVLERRVREWVERTASP